MKRELLISLVCWILSSCAPTVWDKPGATPAEFNQDDGRCRLLARGMNSGTFYAQGSQQFVMQAAMGNAIGTAVATAGTYRDCMKAAGYMPRSADAGRYGAVAFDRATGHRGVAVDLTTQSEAEVQALATCSSPGCTVVIRLGPKMCIAVATPATGKGIGAASRASLADAQSAAMADCKKRNTGRCELREAQCDR